MAPSAISRTAYNALVQDSGDKISGSVWDKADVLDILTAVEGTWAASTSFVFGGSVAGESRLAPAQITAGQANYGPAGLATAFTVTLDSNAAYSIDGLTTGTEGRLLFLHNNGNFTLTLSHENGAATAANRFFFTGAGNFALTANMVCGLLYTNARWRRFAGI